jgi:hypothetical protein
MSVPVPQTEYLKKSESVDRFDVEHRKKSDL